MPHYRKRLYVSSLRRPRLALAGTAFARYRRRGGANGNVLADFFIGAHGGIALTRDTRRYSNYFPSVRLIAPEAP